MPNRQTTTQEIPAWSANLSASAPRSWRDDLRAEADRLGISLGEIQRELLLVGALAKLPALAKKLVAAHRFYYPTRELRIASLATVLLLVFCGSGALHKCERTMLRAHRPKTEWVAEVG